jgi:hypothetical protein
MLDYENLQHVLKERERKWESETERVRNQFLLKSQLELQHSNMKKKSDHEKPKNSVESRL